MTREIQTDLLETEPNADALIAKILHRAELEYQFCSAGDADPASLQMQKACAEYKPTDDFHIPFIKESLATSVYTAIPTSNSNCEMDKLCEEKS